MSSSQRIAPIAMASLGFLVLLAGAGLSLLRASLDRPAPAPATPYVGTVQFERNDSARCERFAFDNRTGAVDQVSTPCTPAAGSSDQGGDRLRGVHDYFRSR
jgi:hypothetical protein